MMKATERPSADLLRKFSIICGEKTTTQQAMEMEPARPDSASMSRVKVEVWWVEGGVWWLWERREDAMVDGGRVS